MTQTNVNHSDKVSADGSAPITTPTAPITTPTPTPTTTPPRPTERDLQRSALRDLVELSAQCAADELRIDQQLQQSLDAAEQEARKAHRQIEQVRDSQRQQADEQHDHAAAQADAQFAAESAALQETRQHQQHQIRAEHEPAEQQVRQRYDQAVWLADTVMEATQNRVQDDARKAEQDLAAQQAALDAMDQNVAVLLDQYGQSALRIDVPPPQALGDADNPAETYRAQLDLAQRLLDRLAALRVPRLFVGLRPYLIVAVVCVIAAGAAQWVAGELPRAGSFEPAWSAIGLTLLATGLLLGTVGATLRQVVGRAHIRAVCAPFRQAIQAARHAATAQQARTLADGQRLLSHARQKRKQETQAARDQFGPMLARIVATRDAALKAAQDDVQRQFDLARSRHDRTRRELDARQQQALADIQRRHDHDLADADQRRDKSVADARSLFESEQSGLQQRWRDGLARIAAPITHGHDGNGCAPELWDDQRWANWSPPHSFASLVRFGQLQVDLKQVTDRVPRRLELPPRFSVPASLAFPRQSSLLIHTDHDGRADALRTLQMVMMRLLTNLPPGRARFTIIDPIGLGENFAGFMHLADHDEALVGGRIWTETDHIQQRLADLTEHMETVIQKYLRNEFETIDDYNAQAGELAEPYRFLVIADFPTGFEGDAFRRLNSIAASGARCGVYTLVIRDTRQPLPAGVHLDELESHSVNLVREQSQFVWKDEVFHQFPLTIDAAPSEAFITRIMDVVGRRARQSKRVEVAFQSIAPVPDKLWSGDCTEELRVPIGRMGATRLQSLRLGRGVAQHALIAGKTGAGKSTLLHVLVTNLALWYHPDQVEFYLIDFKKGVEFKTYATHALPHARAIAVESDREFGLSVLQRLDGELTRRGELFRAAAVQDLAAYRQQTRRVMPRTLLIIDEFQEFFSEDDRLAQDAALLLDRLVRQGRAFGIHVLLGSQTIGGTSGLARSTLGQMAVRIALQTSEADSQLILGDNNLAARLLSRPGEAIYNDAGGLVEGNSPFQVAWLSDEQREAALAQVHQQVQQHHVAREGPIVFEGNAPGDIRKNRHLDEQLRQTPAPTPPAPVAWVGEPVAIKMPTNVALRRQSGSNLLLVGQQEDAALWVLVGSILSLAAQHAPRRASFRVFDGTPADSVLVGTFDRLKPILPHALDVIEWRAVPEAIHALCEELHRRQEHEPRGAPSLYLVIYGLQRYRVLRRQEENFSFAADAEEKPAQPDKEFAEILRDGPPLGIHALAWVDTVASLERTIDRASMREFDHRILFQMSANDSSNLIDSPAANRLGPYRALAFSEEQGILEKFRPYGPPDPSWLESLRTALASATT